MARKVGFSKEDVVHAAAELADIEGMSSVTLASVAERLAIRSPSLYAHVEGLEGLRRELALRAAAELGDAIRGAASERHGLAALREIAFAYRGFAEEHPGLYQAAQHAADRRTDPVMYDAMLAVVQPVFHALADAGVTDPADQVHLTRALRSGLHGFVALEQISFSSASV
jgi:AcrR family transcriptional regulator